MRTIATLCALLGALSIGACSSGVDGVNSGPPDTGPGCYDHKGRIERTIPTRAECDTQGWIWKP
jgi:hypothetical protein